MQERFAERSRSSIALLLGPCVCKLNRPKPQRRRLRASPLRGRSLGRACSATYWARQPQTRLPAHPQGRSHRLRALHVLSVFVSLPGPRESARLLSLKSSPMTQCHQQSRRHILTHRRTLQILSMRLWLLSLPPPTHSPHSERRTCSKWPLHCVTTLIQTLRHVPTAAGIKLKDWLPATSPKPSSNPSPLGP